MKFSTGEIFWKSQFLVIKPISKPAAIPEKNPTNEEITEYMSRLMKRLNLINGLITQDKIQEVENELIKRRIKVTKQSLADEFGVCRRTMYYTIERGLA